MKNLDTGLKVQLILLIILMILMVLAIFNKIFLPIADFVAGLTFGVMAYNKRESYSKFMTILMILFGVLFIGLGVYNLING